MTVAVAVMRNDRVALAADSLVNFGGQRYPASNTRFNKIHRIGESWIAWAGWSLYAELLEAHLKVESPPRLDTEAEIFAFFVQFWRALRVQYHYDHDVKRSPGFPIADFDSVFLLVNRAGIFRVAADMDVTQFQEYCAVGTGSKYALGAMRVLYENTEDVSAVARQAVQVGIDFDIYCGGTIDVVEVTV